MQGDGLAAVRRVGARLMVCAVLLLVSGQGDGLRQADELNGRVVGLFREGKYAEAEPLARQALSLRETLLGPDHAEVGSSLNNLAALIKAQGRLAEAEPLYRRALAISEKVFGPEHPETALGLNNLATVLQAQGRYAEAEPLFRRTLAILERTLGPEHPNTVATLNNIAVLLRVLGRYNEAEPLYQRVLAANEKRLGPDHPNVAMTLINLGALLRAQGRYGEAEALDRRALAIRETALGPEHPYVAASLNNLAGQIEAQGRLAEAEPLYRRALAIYEKALGAEHPEVATARNNLAGLLRGLGRFAEAEVFQRQALASWEAGLGPDHPEVATSLDNLGALLAEQGRFAEAVPLQRRALAIRERSLGAEHPDVALSLSNLAGVLRQGGDLAGAIGASRRAVGILASRFARPEAGRSSGRGAEQRSWRGDFLQLVSLLAAGEKSDASTDEAFRTAQLAGALETARAVSGMAARFAAGGDALAGLVRERQDLTERWRNLDQALLKAASLPPDERDGAAEDKARRDLAEADARLLALDARLGTDFPRYAEVANPRPVSIAEVQALLAPDEALVAWTIAAGESFVFALRKDRAVFARIDLKGADLKEAVVALRRGLEPPEAMQSERDLPKFDASAAHALYQTLFAPAEPLLADARHVFVVPHGALQSLPLGVLVTAEPKAPIRDFQDYAEVPWLARRFAISVLPAVSSLRALRLFAAQARASAPFAGFGDPDFRGSGGSARGVKAAKLFRGSQVDVDELRQLPRLAETADELRAQSLALHAAPGSVVLGGDASETAVKHADLRDVRVITFATHGLVAGDFDGLAEPALALSPPATASTDDDGLLTASEVAQLKLNADWVVLSACNTAAPDGNDGAEGLSGLAKAFFYAGARSLLVSHWPVSSTAAVSLTTGAFKALEQAPGIGRSEATRRSMLAMIDGARTTPATAYLAHPLFWAPFILVGEGAAGR